jgi:hypothetical protein
MFEADGVAVWFEEIFPGGEGVRRFSMDFPFYKSGVAKISE